MTAKFDEFLKCIWKDLKVVVACTSTLKLPWQPGFYSRVFQNFK